MQSKASARDERRFSSETIVGGQGSEVEIRFNDGTGLPSVRLGRSITSEDVRVVDDLLDDAPRRGTSS